MKPITFQNLKESIAVAANCGGHVVLVTDRFRYWQRDLDKHVPVEMEELVSIASPADIKAHGFPQPLSSILIDGRVPRTAQLAMWDSFIELGSDMRLIDRPDFVIDEVELPY
jgi:hypothetical protein